MREELLALLAEYEKESGNEESAMRDLLTDLRHIADDQDIDFEQVDLDAREVYFEELEHPA